MQLFLGGACAGKRERVSERFPQASWIQASEALERMRYPRLAETHAEVVVHGWLKWLEEVCCNRNGAELENDALRECWRQAFKDWAGRESAEVVLIVPEVGRGIVPVEPFQRQLRDLAGWLAQDAAEASSSVWHVRHGLVMALK
ncbi:bifunctional adenosylcobinamide kinase/adenosylcobinamide-phosphate guanylyltransferase [Halomonas binhaiensis]|uniref:Bifunctional adenosylcobinamide kinase/adenosylcobinamide-phosphate guanylyltransferase n=1 Tax=Halomonas binhaiensis TaxID=2562282 RepID=A0A5C1NHA9_9GAMM|nr:bifunctional adenosylcobinamide kinase/adenosylcobinamide-phosphate guanylyltransferase [Halomonas binhaiensis]QEM82300.1 bifunctional adenosylcobinamide kinase/adenosylcobinamide-phosphate guanylyltransferase [Halomonas binhaiensis]